jgi:hypothetical protein
VGAGIHRLKYTQKEALRKPKGHCRMHRRSEHATASYSR